MSISTTVRERVTAIRDQARERRQERAERLVLERELASYRTPNEVEELLTLMADQEGGDAQRIRDILLDNVRPTVGLGRIA
jgi:hypothetical protein